MQYWPNPDERVRKLERTFASSGDISDAEALFSARMRTGELSPSDIELLAVLGFREAQTAFTGLGRAGKPKWNAKTLWQEQGQYRGYRLALAALKFTIQELFENSPEIEAVIQVLDGANVENYNEFRKAKAFNKIKARLVSLEKELLAAGTEKSWDDRHFIFEQGQIPPKLIAQHTALSNIMEIRNMLSSTKTNSFYKIGNSIMDSAILVMAAKLEETPAKKSKTRTPRLESKAAVKNEKVAMAKLYDEVILPEALRLVLMTSGISPSAISRDRSYYENEIKSGRFSNISVHAPHSLTEDCPCPKKVSQIWQDDYVQFIVWTSSKKEAKQRAEKILYNLFGFIPHFSIYTAGYKTQAVNSLEDGTHEDALFPDGLSEVPSNVINLWERSQFLSSEERKQLQKNENYVCKNIARLRPDLY